MRKKELMLRTFGFSKLSPRKENRIIFYSLLVLLLSTFLYILTYYFHEPEKEGMNGKKENYGMDFKGERKASRTPLRPNLSTAKPHCRNENFLNFSGRVESFKSFTKSDERRNSQT